VRVSIFVYLALILVTALTSCRVIVDNVSRQITQKENVWMVMWKRSPDATFFHQKVAVLGAGHVQNRISLGAQRKVRHHQHDDTLRRHVIAVAVAMPTLCTSFLCCTG